ncbi:MIP/aquaporin family protein [Schleiferilactobacillus perolens]|jgi:glycerol uptake facilitator protein|uniref:Glycerol MIP family major intrinsic protein channel protein n=1 Tax=Schleiferilactobacillus perolens DSM 12744 TaxID=1423792 RepID=A0A0R1N9G3_9LACO|nr:MIP/aquaporin family protein [Schleiferilactobacillus perolens]KRL13016.1 glycerol MIP family major intrinsic protein channel protein [Schleiferilactobacillus perolens DSM 12744]MCI1891686.1 aquaporin family protein [Schleiferilactobacillus harbinensis]MCI1912032.1 aquaporin family protein [Schleiferilactobacillus harbinensis]MCI2171752.1 aquaporin family protein [Schleiferilactobacillus perolens]
MDFALTARLAAEMIGTAIMVILGNGAVANVDLEGTKGNGSDWMLIAVGYGAGVMIPALLFGSISGNHINPAFTLGLATAGLFPWSEVAPYIAAQFTGAIVGQLIVIAAYKPHYDLTTNSTRILGTFSTIDATASQTNGFITEFIGSFILFFSALGITKAPFFQNNLGTAHLALGFLVGTLVASLGGPTGPALNPARDLGPRIVHALMPLKNKGDSQWSYAWIPVVAPILAAIAAVGLYKIIFM